LCLCIALSINDHKDDPRTPCLDDPGKHEGKASVKSEFSGIRLFKTLENASMKHALDPKLIATIIFVESGGNHTAISTK